jgi:lysozyme
MMADEKKKPKLAELLNQSSKQTVSSNDTVLDLMNQNHIILTQISDNFYNIAGKLGAQVSSMREVEAAIIAEEKQAEPVSTTTEQPQAVAVNKNQEQKPKKESSGFGLMALGAALMFGKDIIEGMINFFKNPFEIISNLLGSLGDSIVEWFEEGGFKDFLVEAFNEGKKELIKTFENLKDIFKIIIGDPVANLIDNIKLSFIGISIDGLKMLPDWLKGDSVKEIEKNLEKARGNIEAGKETRAQENQATREDLKKRNAKPAAGSEEPPKQTSEDLKEDTPQQEPVSTPPSPAPAPTPTVTTLTGASVTTESGATLKTGAEETQSIPTASDKTPPSTKVATAVEKPTAGGTTAPSVGPDDKEIMEMIKKHEGVRTKPYKDSLGLWTVGVGHLIGDGKTLPPEWNRELSMAEVDELFYKDYMSHKKAAMKIPGFNLVNAKAQGALIDLTFNMGNTWFKKWPNFVKNLSEGNTVGAAASLEDSNWYKQVKGRAVTIVSLIKQGASNAMGMASSPSTGVQTAQAGADVNAAKKKQTTQVVYNVNNSVATAVKVGAPQGSSTTVARDVG